MNDVATTGFDFPDLVDEAVFRAGGQTATAQDVVNIRRSLRILLERWTAKGFNTWRFGTTEVLITGTETGVKLSPCVDDVINVNSVTSGGSESPMRRIGVDEYSKLTTKTTQGQPSMYYLDRGIECPTLFIYPIGRANTMEKVVVTYVERPAGYDRNSNDVDTPGRWLEALVLGLALDLAKKRPPFDNDTIARLTTEAREAEDTAQRADRNRHSFRLRMGGRR